MQSNHENVKYNEDLKFNKTPKTRQSPDNSPEKGSGDVFSPPVESSPLAPTDFRAANPS